MNNRTIEQINCVIATAVAAGSVTFDKNMRLDYDVCTGFSIVENSVAALTRYNVKIESANGNIIMLESVNGKMIRVGDNLQPNDRFYTIGEIPSKGIQYTVTITTFATTSGEFNIDVLFNTETRKAA